MKSKESFTKEDVINTAFAKYGKPVSTDMIDDAMLEKTLADAVEVIIVDSMYWDGGF